MSARRTCKKCSRRLPDHKFQRSPDGTPFGYTCNACRSDYMKEKYAERAAFVRKLKSEPCMDCGKTFPPYCMDFDHREADSKEAAVSKMSTYSLDRMLAEIAKCDLVCVLCHRIRTHNRGN